MQHGFAIHNFIKRIKSFKGFYRLNEGVEERAIKFLENNLIYLEEDLFQKLSINPSEHGTIRIYTEGPKVEIEVEVF